MARSLSEGHILSHKTRALARKLKPITFSRNWEIVTTCGTLQNVVLGKNISKHDII